MDIVLVHVRMWMWIFPIHAQSSKYAKQRGFLLGFIVNQWSSESAKRDREENTFCTFPLLLFFSPLP